MNLLQRIELTVMLIQKFRNRCNRTQHTDTGEAWEVLGVIEETWNTFLTKGGLKAQTEKKPETEAMSPETKPENAPGEQNSD